MAHKRKRKKNTISPDDLAPGIAKGLTVGASAKEALEEHPVKGKSGIELVRDLAKAERVIGTRVPLPKFIGREAPDSPLIMSYGDERRFRDVTLLYPPDVLRAMREGMLCFKCGEPQAHAWEDRHLPGCAGVDLHGGTYMRERQILDMAMEMEGEVHVGPSKPLSEFADEQDLRIEKRAFIDRVLDGGQGKIPKEWLRDATLMDGLHPQQREALRAS